MTARQRQVSTVGASTAVTLREHRRRAAADSGRDLDRVLVERACGLRRPARVALRPGDARPAGGALPAVLGQACGPATAAHLNAQSRPRVAAPSLPGARACARRSP